MKRLISFFLVLCMLITLLATACAEKIPFIDDPERITDSANSVVMLYCYDRNGDLIATGSGFTCIEDGIIVTNYHVIEGISDFQAQTEDGMYFRIDMEGILAWDKDIDIAILKTNARTRMTLLPIGSAYKMLKGSKVIAIGSPKGYVNSVSSGLFSGIVKDGGIDYIQFDAAISPGSSGGALFNNDGEVIGITTWTRTDANSLNFAVPIERVMELWEKYESGNFENSSSKEEMEAMKLFNAGEYTEAKIIFESLGLTDMVNECEYQRALDLVINERYDEAISTLKELSEKNYSDASHLLLEVKNAYIIKQIELANKGEARTKTLKLALSYANDLKDASYQDSERIYKGVVDAIYGEALLKYNEGNYIYARELFASIYDIDYRLSRIMYAVCLTCTDRINYDSNNEEYYNILINNIDIPEVKDALLYNHSIALHFLKGEWRETHGIHFDIDEDGSLEDGLPRVISGSGYWMIENGILKSYTDADRTHKNDKAIKIITKDQIEVYCYADGKTYTLNRKK